MDEKVREFFQSNGIAVIGVSGKKAKFGSMAYRALKKKGFRVYGVNPALDSCDGERCYSRLSEIPDSVEAALVVVRPEKVKGFVSEASRAGVKRVWFQQGSDYSGLAAEASEVGMSVVTDRCILMYAEPVVGIHRFHRFFAKLFGKF